MPAQPQALTTEQLKLLQPAEREAYKKSLELVGALRSPLAYGEYVSNMRPYPHVKHTDEMILAAMDGRLYKSGVSDTRCIFLPSDEYPEDDDEGIWVHPVTGEPAIFNICISKPPRHGKSYHISQHTPAWFLTKYPSLFNILVSYETDFAASFGKKARDLIIGNPEFGVNVRKDAQAGQLWLIENNTGVMISAGRAAGVTGKGWHFGIMDDLIKDAIEAQSPTTQRQLIDFWVSVMKTRRQPHPARERVVFDDDSIPDIFCVCVSLATRWNLADLHGYLLAEEPDEWYFINMPALAFQNEQSKDYGDPRRCVLGRSPGEPLEPRIFNRSTLLKIANSGERGKHWFNSLYQGTPRMEEGGIIPSTFGRYSVIPGVPGEEPILQLTSGEQIKKLRCYEFATVDLAATTKTSADWSVYAHWLVTPAPNRRLVLWAIHRRRLETPDLGPWLKRLYLLYRPSFMGIEKESFGLAVLQQLRREGGTVTRELIADKDKLARSLPFGDLVRAEMVFIPQEAEWVDDWVDEHIVFNKGTHDDMVDCSGYAADIFNKMPRRMKTKEERPRTMHEHVQAELNELAGKKKRRRKALHDVLGKW